MEPGGAGPPQPVSRSAGQPGQLPRAGLTRGRGRVPAGGPELLGQGASAETPPAHRDGPSHRPREASRTLLATEDATGPQGPLLQPASLAQSPAFRSSSARGHAAWVAVTAGAAPQDTRRPVPWLVPPARQRARLLLAHGCEMPIRRLAGQVRPAGLDAAPRSVAITQSPASRTRHAPRSDSAVSSKARFPRAAVGAACFPAFSWVNGSEVPRHRWLSSADNTQGLRLLAAGRQVAGEEKRRDPEATKSSSGQALQTEGPLLSGRKGSEGGTSPKTDAVNPC